MFFLSFVLSEFNCCSHLSLSCPFSLPEQFLYFCDMSSSPLNIYFSLWLYESSLVFYVSLILFSNNAWVPAIFGYAPLTSQGGRKTVISTMSLLKVAYTSFVAEMVFKKLHKHIIEIFLRKKCFNILLGFFKFLISALRAIPWMSFVIC